MALTTCRYHTMLVQQNQLRMHRRRTRLTQSDMASLMGFSDSSDVSRWEQMRRRADSIALLTYHVVFGIPVEPPHVENAQRMAAGIAERAAGLLEALRGLPAHPRTAQRISFLESLIDRLGRTEP